MYEEAYNHGGLPFTAGQAKKWKIQAAEMYEKEGLKKKASELYESIEQSDGPTTKKQLQPLLDKN